MRWLSIPELSDSNFCPGGGQQNGMSHAADFLHKPRRGSQSHALPSLTASQQAQTYRIRPGWKPSNNTREVKGHKRIEGTGPCDQGKQRFYAVVKGNSPGIYVSDVAARRAYEGYPNAVHIRFFSRSAAEEFLRAHGLRSWRDQSKSQTPRKPRLEPLPRTARRADQHQRQTTLEQFWPACNRLCFC